MAVLQLNIYEKDKVVKTYECKTYHMSFGTLEDLLELMESTENVQDTFKQMKMLRPFMKEIFEDVTDEELRKVRVEDVFQVMYTAMDFAMNQINSSADPNV